MWFVCVHDDYILYFPFKLLKSWLLGEKKKMLWIIPLHYVKTMWKPWLMTWLQGISLNDICSTAMRLLITTTCELRKKPLKMTADKHNKEIYGLPTSRVSIPCGVNGLSHSLCYRDYCDMKMVFCFFFFSLFLFKSILSEYQVLPSRENHKYESCRHRTFRGLSPSFP